MPGTRQPDPPLGHGELLRVYRRHAARYDVTSHLKREHYLGTTYVAAGES